MFTYKQQMLAATCLSALGVLVSTAGANAAAGDIWGGGASVIAPYWRQLNDCYALPTQLIVKGTPPTFVTESPFNYPGLGTAHTQAQDCSTTHIDTDRTSYYISASSGAGILASFSHDPKQWGFIDAGQTQYAPEVHYDLSETPLTSTDVGIYDNGGTETQGKSSIAVNTPSSGQACNTNVSGTYANPAACYGPLVQFPVSITPLAIAYNSVYEQVYNPANQTTTSYHFHINYKRSDSSGGLRLDATTYCKIFNGQITNWNDPALKALNGNKSLEDPTDPTPAASWSVPLQIVGRGDSAGTTSTLTRHLAAVCPNLITGNNYTTGTSTLPAALLGPSYNSANPNYPPVAGETLGKFTLATANTGVAQYVAFPSGVAGQNGNPNTIILGRVTYISPDFVLPYVLKTNTNSYGLQSATLKDAKGSWEEPTPKSASVAFGKILPPQSTSTGAYKSTVTANGLRVNPQDWVQGTSPTASLANPTVGGAYPIVGTANFVGYQCYASSTQTSTILGVLNYLYFSDINTDAKNGILVAGGISPLPTAWRNAIKGTFLVDTDKLGLNIASTGTAGTCSTAGSVGG